MMLNNSGVMDGVHEAGIEAQRGGSHYHHQHGFKKGPWTKEEDERLIEYVEKHGEGNWGSVQKNMGLARCGKSCRLRWVNHLRSDLKKGPLSLEEARKIIELHAKFGNKWARIASELPGRTDNEIKNLWNTRMKHLQRAGLPDYHHDLQQEAAAAAFHQHQPRQYSSSTSASSFSLLHSSSQPRKPNNFSPSQLSFYFPSTSDHQNPNNNYPLQNHHHNSSSLYSNSMTQFHANGGFAMPLSPVSPFGSSAHGGFGCYNNPMIMGPPIYDPTPLVEESNPELTSNQTQMGGSGYTATGDHYGIAPVPSQGNTGLLEDVLVEAQNISNKKAKSGDSYSSGWPCKEKGVMGEDEDSLENDDEMLCLLDSPSAMRAFSELLNM